VVDALRALGQDPALIDAWSSSMGHAHAIEVVREGTGATSTATLAAASDPRSEGLPAAW
jgi:hypothetical protein